MGSRGPKLKVHIYGLRDPRDGKIRYVGKTASPPSFRLQSHVDFARRHPENSRPVSAWIRELYSWGLKPEIVLLEDVPIDRWRQAEREWGIRLNAKTRLANSISHLGNGPVHSGTARWTPELEARLGLDTDAQIAADMGITRKAVSYRRAVLGIVAPLEHWQRGKPPPMGGHNRIVLSDAILARLGKAPDYVLAAEAGVAKAAVARLRRKVGIPDYATQTGRTGKFAKGNFPSRWAEAGDQSRCKRDGWAGNPE